MATAHRGGADLRLRSIELQRFRGFRAPTRITLQAGISVLVGDNGSGKSSVCNAVEWCLFGRTVETKGSGIAEYKDRARTSSSTRSSKSTSTTRWLESAPG